MPEKKVNGLRKNSLKKLQMKTLILFIAVFAIYSARADKPISLHDFVVEDIYGDQFNLAELKGKKVMIVNTASRCGLTPQFSKLEELYKTYSDKNFIIIGFPANNFNNQEPGNNEEIIAFCEENYGVSFPMMSKISVKGQDMHPLYKWLTQKSENGVTDSEVSWNFQKYLINENGYLVKYLPPRHDPLSEDIIEWINQ
jgi:glutathione peroxidase